MQRAGFWGQLILHELACISGEFGFEGFVPDEYLDPSFLARRLMWDGDPACVTGGVTAAVTAGLLVRDEGGVTIDGWDRKQPKMAKSGAQRQAEYRARQKAKKLGLVAGGGGERDETSSRVTPLFSSPSSSEVSTAVSEEIASAEKISNACRRGELESPSPTQVGLGLGPVGVVEPPPSPRPRPRPAPAPEPVQVLTEAEGRFAAKLAQLRSELCGGMPLPLQGHETELRHFMVAHSGEVDWGCQTLRNWVERDPKYTFTLNPRGRLEVFLLQSQWPRFQDPKPEQQQDRPAVALEGPAGVAWSGALRQLELDGKSYALNWLRQIRPIELTNESLVLETPDRYSAGFVTDTYDKLLRDALSRTMGREVGVEVRPAEVRAAG